MNQHYHVSQLHSNDLLFQDIQKSGLLKAQKNAFTRLLAGTSMAHQYLAIEHSKGNMNRPPIDHSLSVLTRQSGIKFEDFMWKNPLGSANFRFPYNCEREYLENGERSPHFFYNFI